MLHIILFSDNFFNIFVWFLIVFSRWERYTGQAII